MGQKFYFVARLLSRVDSDIRDVEVLSQADTDRAKAQAFYDMLADKNGAWICETTYG